MLPVLFRIVIPAGWGTPVVVLAVLAIVVSRALGAVRLAGRDGEALSLGQALKGDAWLVGALALGAAALHRSGFLAGELRLPVHAYGLLIAAGFLSGIWIAQREARRRGQDG